MCGIIGLVNLQGEAPDEALLIRMTDVIEHRGPDDEGVEIIGQCGLGNRRLAVIDLSLAGHMPMWDYEKKVCITYNGEIYNFNKLKQDLLKRGCRFRSNSDTEVIVNLYKEYGENCFAKLRGMFALAIWDREKKKLVLARDQFGIKPLHYYLDRKELVFGSEIKSILLHSGVKKEINPIALSHYFALGFGCIASPETIFKNIKKLEPASCLILEKGKVRIKKYWDLAKIEESEIDFEDAKNKIRDLIEQSVREQLVSDVPLGSFLSGGLDSSLITAFSQKYTQHSIKTFSIGFEDKKFDESEYAQQVAQYLKTDHYHKQFSQRELMEILPELIEKLDEPLADASILPTYLLSKFTRQNVTVSLSGDGGDEIFAGYPTYLAHKYGQYLNWMPDSLRSLAKNGAKMFSFLPIFKHAGHLSVSYKIDRFVDGLNRDKAKQYLNFMGPCHTELKNNLINQTTDAALDYVNNLISQSSEWDLQKQLQYLDFMIYMEEDCLVKTDRASSFNSLEVRPPFLNVELAEFAFSLPSKDKIKGNNLKYILKESARGIIPDNIIDRSKKGFGIPTGSWLRQSLKKQVDDLLDQKKIKRQGLFDELWVKKIKNEHFNGEKNHRMLLWNLFVFQLWWERWMK